MISDPKKYGCLPADKYHEFMEPLAVQLGRVDLSRLGATYMGQTSGGVSLRYGFPEHTVSLAFYRVDGIHINDIWLHVGEEQIKVFQSYSGAWWMEGDHWDYLRDVLTPWVKGKADVLLTKDKKEAARKEEARREGDHAALARWVASRAGLPVPPKPVREPSLEEDWLDVRPMRDFPA